jgi:rsbT antagonist protein RsbS
MSTIPVLRLGNVLIVTLHADLDDAVAADLQDVLSERIVAKKTTGVLIDISQVDVVDSFMARAIANVSSIAQLLDSSTVVVGMQPAVAITLVELGISMSGVRAALDIDRGMALLQGGADVPW